MATINEASATARAGLRTGGSFRGYEASRRVCASSSYQRLGGQSMSLRPLRRIRRMFDQVLRSIRNRFLAFFLR